MVDLIPSHKKGIHVMKKNPYPLTFYVVVVAASILLLAPSAPAQEKKKEDQKSAPANSAATPSPTPIYVDRVFSSKEVTNKARILTRPEPQYTESARDHGIEGTVVIRAVLDSSGKVKSIRVVSGLPYGLTEKAVDAAHQLKFVPAVKDGRPVSQYIQIEYNFTFYDDADSPDLKQKPQILDQPQPEYTEEARQYHTEGKVVLTVLLVPTARGINIVALDRVIQPLAYGLTEQAVQAALKIKFKPALNKNGKPVIVRKRLEYEFKL
jgi:TonB family protein